MKIPVLLWVVACALLYGCSPLRTTERVSDEVLRNSQINHRLELVVLDDQNNNDIGERPFIVTPQKIRQPIASQHTLIGALYPLIRPDEYRECLLPFADALIYSEEEGGDDDNAVSSTFASDGTDVDAINGDGGRRTSLNFRSVQAVVDDNILLHPQYQNELTEIIGFIQQLDTQPQYYRLGAVRALQDGTVSAQLFVANDTSYTVARIVCARHEQQWHVGGFAINIYDLAEDLFDSSPPFSPHSNRSNRLTSF